MPTTNPELHAGPPGRGSRRGGGPPRHEDSLASRLTARPPEPRAPVPERNAAPEAPGVGEKRKEPGDAEGAPPAKQAKVMSFAEKCEIWRQKDEQVL